MQKKDCEQLHGLKLLDKVHKARLWQARLWNLTPHALMAMPVKDNWCILRYIMMSSCQNEQ